MIHQSKTRVACALITMILTVPLLSVVFSAPAVAADTAFSIRQAVVWVHCGSRQGSGVVVNGQKGYVLTNAHVLMDLETLRPGRCEVGFVGNENLEPSILYSASWVKYVFDESSNRDFAILQIGEPKGPIVLTSFPSLQTDEFSEVSDPVSVMSYPDTSDGRQASSSGYILGFDSGRIQTDAVFSSGSSGGPAVDGKNDLIGLATGILYREVSPGVEELVDYELVDIRSIIAWLDTYGVNYHDEFVIHHDLGRYHGPQAYLTQSSLTCDMLGRTAISDTVYCLKPDMTRQVFPNSQVFHSWFPDFSMVTTVEEQELARYRLISNVTLKQGTLIKIESDPKVYLVTDATGTLRWIETESRAQGLYGQGWAGLVQDVPVSFFQNYRIGEPLPQ